MGPVKKSVNLYLSLCVSLTLGSLRIPALKGLSIHKKIAVDLRQ